MNLYKVLEIDENASLDEIKKSYRRLARKYHPDKTISINNISSKNNLTNKFLEISSAYEILSNDKARMEYIKLKDTNKTQFQEFLNNIFGHKIDISSLSNYGITLTKSDMDYIKSDLGDILKRLNLKEIFNLFNNNVLPRKENIPEYNLCSDTDDTNDMNIWSYDDAYYFESLPIAYQKSSDYTLNIIQEISLDNLLNNEKGCITLKRKVLDEFVNTEFKYEIKSQWVVFNGGGDLSEDGEYYGNLIIKLNLPNNYDWQDNLIIYQKKINLYEFVYGLEINDSFGTDRFNIINWNPIREGNIISILTKDNKKSKSWEVLIKLIVDIEYSESNKQILNDNFN
jgi:hypothetical protein